jgi:hypothetical protein
MEFVVLLQEMDGQGTGSILSWLIRFRSRYSSPSLTSYPLSCHSNFYRSKYNR